MFLFEQTCNAKSWLHILKLEWVCSSIGWDLMQVIPLFNKGNLFESGASTQKSSARPPVSIGVSCSIWRKSTPAWAQHASSSQKGPSQPSYSKPEPSSSVRVLTVLTAALCVLPKLHDFFNISLYVCCCVCWESNLCEWPWALHCKVNLLLSLCCW